jgi:Na+-driven multidrug efflux pump
MIIERRRQETRDQILLGLPSSSLSLRVVYSILLEFLILKFDLRRLACPSQGFWSSFAFTMIMIFLRMFFSEDWRVFFYSVIIFSIVVQKTRLLCLSVTSFDALVVIMMHAFEGTHSSIYSLLSKSASVGVLQSLILLPLNHIRWDALHKSQHIFHTRGPMQCLLHSFSMIPSHILHLFFSLHHFTSSFLHFKNSNA